MTSKELYRIVMEENRPIDYGWIRSVKRTDGDKGLKAMARSCVECFAPHGASKHLIGRATTMVYWDLVSYAY